MPATEPPSDVPCIAALPGDKWCVCPRDSDPSVVKYEPVTTFLVFADGRVVPATAAEDSALRYWDDLIELGATLVPDEGWGHYDLSASPRHG